MKENEYRTQIVDLEKEGDDLEKLETELLRKLQETQKQERDAFTRLEDAMVNGSIPPQLRAATDEQSVQKSIANPTGKKNEATNQSIDQQ